MMIDSIWDGKKFTPRMISMSSVRPVTRCILTRVRPQAHGSTVSREMSRVRYRISGWPSLAKFVMTSSPSSPYGSTSPVSGSMISG